MLKPASSSGLRTEYSLGSLAAGTIIAGIVRVGAVHDGLEAMFFGVGGQFSIGFLLAEETAVGGVGKIVRIGGFI